MLAGELFRLVYIRLYCPQLVQHRHKARRLRRGDGVGNNGRSAVPRGILHALRREIRVEHDGVKGVYLLHARGEVFRRDALGDLHVGNADLHIARLVRDIEIGGAAPLRQNAGKAHVYAELAAVVEYPLPVHVPAHGGDEADAHAQQAQVMRDVAPDTARAGGDDAGVRVAHDELCKRTAADVHIHAADNGDVRRAYTFHMLCAYSAMARSAANTPLLAVFTSARRAYSRSSAMRP